MSWALIAGGSKGIGYCISEALGRRGYDILLVARKPEDLAAAKNRLESQFAVRVEILPADLSLSESPAKIADWCLAQKIDLQILCNVAGLGGSTDFPDLSPADLTAMVRTNVESPMGLTLALLPILQKNSPSYILNTGSLAGFAPFPVKNIYSATKSALLFFSYSLGHQLREKNISVSCLCPGPVFTKPSIEQETRKKLGWLGSQMAVTPALLGELAVRDLLKRKMIIIPGALATLASWALRLMPARLSARILS